MSFYRKLFAYGLKNAKRGTLTVRERYSGASYTLGGDLQGYKAELTISDPYFYRHTVLFGEVGFGEAYVAGMWESEDLARTLRWFAHNSESLPGFAGSGFEVWFINVLGFANRIRHFLRPNSIKLSRKNIAEHYDIGNDLYELMLGRTMAYSCALFGKENESLDAAQERKFAVLCEKLQLEKSDHLLEIGSGWGGFAIYAARRYGCRVTTVTISKEQYQYATEWVRRERLQNRVEVLFSDYRKLAGQFDKIVSIEMAEAIGYRYFDTYFQKLASLLKPGGLAALQYITIPEPRYERYLKNTDFIQIHIFPGSCLLSNLEVLQSIHRTSDLVLLDLETIGQHYATTLRHWRNNVLKNRNKLQQLGYSEKFLRKWIYYLTFCEAGFAERVINDVQVVFGRANQTTYRDFHGHLPAYKDRFGYGK